MNTKAETKAISLEFDLPHPPVKVWRALTWWDGIVRCEVLEVDPPKRLRYSWPSGPESSGLDTVVTWTLTPTPSGGTRTRAFRIPARSCVRVRRGKERVAADGGRASGRGVGGGRLRGSLVWSRRWLLRSVGRDGLRQ